MCKNITQVYMHVCVRESERENHLKIPLKGKGQGAKSIIVPITSIS